MATTNFVDGVTRIVAAWLNDVNDVVYDDIGGPGVLPSGSGTSRLGWLRTATGAVLHTLYQWLGWQGLSAFEFMTNAQITDVQAGTKTLDVSAALQAWATAGIGKKMYAPAGSYRQDSAVSYGDGSTILGDGIGATKFYTALNIEQVNNVSGAYNITFRDVGFYSTFPVADVAGPAFTGTTSTVTSTLTAVSSVVGLFKGMRITGTGIPAGTYILKFTSGPNVIYMCNSVGTPVNGTANGSPSVSSFFRQGQTKFHIHFFDAGHVLLDNCGFFTSFVDSDYSPNNHAGAWFERTALSQYFINTVDNCWMHHAQILMGTSDSNIKNSHVWGNPFDYAVRLEAPGCTVEGCNVSAGQIGGIVSAETVAEPSGASNHSIVGNNIDGGGVFYTGYGIHLTKPVSISIAGNRINQCFKSGVYMNTSVAVDVTANTFLDNNLDGLGYADVENVSTTFQSTAVAVVGNTFYQSSTKLPTKGYAIKEVNAGFYPAQCTYTGNAIAGSGNYITPAFLVVTPTGSGQYPVITGNTGGSIDTETIANPVTNQFTGTLTGCTTAPTGTFTWSRQGNLLTLTIPTLTAVSNTTACTITGAPSGIFPVTAQKCPLAVEDNTVIGMGSVTIGTGGVLTLTRPTEAAFTNAGTKGTTGGNIVYQLVS